MTTQAAAILIVLLSNQGYWFGGQAGTINARWAVKEQVPEAVLEWQLLFGAIRMAEDRVALSVDEQGSTIQITPPAIRVPTQVRWIWRLNKRDGTRIASGEQVIHLYPQHMLEDLSERLRGRKIIVWDAAKGLPSALQEAEIPFETIAEPSDLEFRSPGILLVGPGQVDASAFSQTALVSHAKAGGQVLVFEQRDLARLDGHPLLRRPAPGRMEIRHGHPLFRDIQANGIQSLLTGPADVWAMQLLADEPALELVWWPREVPGTESVPIDALLMVKQEGKGRLVFCQLPLRSWRQDPRSQIFLRNALDYLMTRPEPTPPPSRRAAASRPADRQRRMDPSGIPSTGDGP